MKRRASQVARFEVWCALRADRLKRQLNERQQDYEHRLLVAESQIGWWAGYRASPRAHQHRVARAVA